MAPRLLLCAWLPLAAAGRGHRAPAAPPGPRRALGGESMLARSGPGRCGGEFSLCEDGSCVLTADQCGQCASGQYACPMSVDCVQDVASYESCASLTGTHLDDSLGEEARLDTLVARLDLADMIGQLVNDAPALSKVGLPAYNYLNDDEHGVKGASKATVFPMGVGMGAAWSKQLAFQVGEALGVEARSTHNGLRDKSGNACHSTSTGEETANGCGITLYAPNLNLVRDPRWGRAEEVYGEDPVLTAELAVKMITGLQGNNEFETHHRQGGALMVGASCKHYAVYQNEDLPDVTARDLWETYLPVHKACVQRAKATHVMCSYNAVNGKPSCAHAELLNDVLRQAWGFDGFVVSDYDAWANLVTTHHYVSTFEEAAAAGINAGMDQEGGFGYYPAVSALLAAVEAGNVRRETVEMALRRLMRVRLRLGMLDPPSRVRVMDFDVYSPERQAETPEKLWLARKAARDSIVLFKNDGALPLSKTAFSPAKPLAVVGPQRDDWRVLLGAANYAYEGGPSITPVTVLQGLKDVVGAVNEANGCKTITCVDLDVAGAVEAASNAAATILLLGDSFGSATGSESHDRSAIELPGLQVSLVHALKTQTNTSLICVLLHGGAVSLGSALEDCDAVLDLWVPGQMGGAALADVVFGDFSPAGRAPYTFYKQTADLPDSGRFDEYPEDGVSNGVTYRHFTGEPLFRFGDGLCYTTFVYAWARKPQKSVGACDFLSFSVEVTNTGRVQSDQVVQVYVQSPNSTVPAPRIRLAALERIADIKPGETRTVSFTLAPETHSVRRVQQARFTPPFFYMYADGPSVYVERRFVEAGPLLVHVGGSQPDTWKGGSQPDTSKGGSQPGASTLFANVHSQ
ncbi:glycoside hydrolase superfamily [Pelagophyceae sp. CCMP2097]|nr:glycoside hydrolase superfamily [Pelagophyceae sp. CCMP2097]